MARTAPWHRSGGRTLRFVLQIAGAIIGVILLGLTLAVTALVAVLNLL